MRSKSQTNLLPLLSLAAGALSVWPYLVWLLFFFLDRGRSLPELIVNIAAAVLLVITPCNGLLFGLAGLITGWISLVRRVEADQRNKLFTVLGFGLSLIGILANIWWWIESL